ncbi:MAG: hypothetical protein EPN88_13890 [Bacteroidetes bacterium]|nr:MAG: hypothetical protein EPN88_13890 [Bacteroidota bacterium]
MVELYVTNFKDNYETFNEELKYFLTIEDAKEWIAETFSFLTGYNKSKLFIQDIWVGYIIDYKKDMNQKIQETRIEFREIKPINLGE